MCGNYFWLIFDLHLDGFSKAALILTVLVLWFNFRLIYNKKKIGIMYTFMYCIGVYLGVIAFVYLNMKYIYDDSGLKFY